MQIAALALLVILQVTPVIKNVRASATYIANLTEMLATGKHSLSGASNGIVHKFTILASTIKRCGNPLSVEKRRFTEFLPRKQLAASLTVQILKTKVT